MSISFTFPIIAEIWEICGVFRGGAFVDGVDDELDAVGKSFGDNATITIF